MEESEEKLRDKVIEALSRVIDPEIGLNVWEARLIKDLVLKGNTVSLTFVPSSPICPLAFQLGIDIKKALEKVEEIDKIIIDVDGYIDNARLKSAIEGA